MTLKTQLYHFSWTLALTLCTNSIGYKKSQSGWLKHWHIRIVRQPRKPFTNPYPCGDILSVQKIVMCEWNGGRTFICSADRCEVWFLLQTVIPFSAKSGMNRRGRLNLLVFYISPEGCQLLCESMQNRTHFIVNNAYKMLIKRIPNCKHWLALSQFYVIFM